ARVLDEDEQGVERFRAELHGLPVGGLELPSVRVQPEATELVDPSRCHSRLHSIEERFTPLHRGAAPSHRSRGIVRPRPDATSRVVRRSEFRHRRFAMNIRGKSVLQLAAVLVASVAMARPALSETSQGHERLMIAPVSRTIDITGYDLSSTLGAQ